MIKVITMEEAAKKFKRNFIEAFPYIGRTDDELSIVYQKNKYETGCLGYSFHEVMRRFKANKITLAHMSYRDENTMKEIKNRPMFVLFY